MSKETYFFILQISSNHNNEKYSKNIQSLKEYFINNKKFLYIDNKNIINNENNYMLLSEKEKYILILSKFIDFIKNNQNKDSSYIFIYYNTTNESHISNEFLISLSSSTKSNILLLFLSENPSETLDISKCIMNNYLFNRIFLQVCTNLSIYEDFINNFIIINQLSDIKYTIDNKNENNSSFFIEKYYKSMFNSSIESSSHSFSLLSFKRNLLLSLLIKFNKDQILSDSLFYIGEYYYVKSLFQLECMFDNLKYLIEEINYIDMNNGIDEYHGEYNIYGRNGKGINLNIDYILSNGSYKNEYFYSFFVIYDLIDNTNENTERRLFIDFTNSWYFTDCILDGIVEINYLNVLFFGKFAFKNKIKVFEKEGLIGEGTLTYKENTYKNVKYNYYLNIFECEGVSINIAN